MLSERESVRKEHTLKFFLFTYLFWPHWVFVDVHGLPLAAASGSSSQVAVCGLFTVMASLVAERRLQAHGLWSLQHAGSVTVTHGLQRMGSVTGTHA